MYKSPIEVITEQVNMQIENEVYKAVGNVGINVDREELLKALAYDRGQYEQGYRDALKKQPEQKRGHWVSVPDKSPKTTTINMYSFICSCSECGKAVGHHAEYNYCPGCGAMMKR